MNVNAFYAECRRNRRLLALLFELTYTCDLKCPFCYNEKVRRGDTLSLGHYERAFRDGREEGAQLLTLTGGEPTLHPQFFEIGALGTRLGYSIRVKTNGHGLDEAFLRRMKGEMDPYNLDISIHGATPDVHDAGTGIRGSFERLLRLIPLAQACVLRLRLKFPLTRRNEHQVAEVFALARSWGIGVDPFAEISPADDGDLGAVDLMASPSGVRAMYRENLLAGPRPPSNFLGEEEQDRLSPGAGPEYACGAGLTTLSVDPFGEVYPCVGWRASAGNLHRNSLKGIWHDLPMKRLIEENLAAGERKRLNPCMEGELFCPGRAHIQYGSALTVYPEAVMMARSRREAVASLAGQEDGDKGKNKKGDA